MQPYRLASTHMTQGLCISVRRTIMRPSHSHVGWLNERKSFKEKLTQTSCCVCCVCFVHVKCEGKDKLTSVFLGWCFSGATRFACTQQAYFSRLVTWCRPTVLSRAKHGTMHCTCLCFTLPSRGGAAMIPARFSDM